MSDRHLDEWPEPVRVYGPERCPRPCSDCVDGLHHWLAASLDPDDDADEFAQQHPGVKATEELMLFHYACKHCPAVGLEPEDVADYLAHAEAGDE